MQHIPSKHEGIHRIVYPLFSHLIHIQYPPPISFAPNHPSFNTSPPVPMTRKIEIQRQNPSLKRTPITPLPTPVPLPINNLKRHILIRRPRLKPNDTKLLPLRRLQHKLWCFSLINKIRIKNIKFVPLNGFGRGIVVVVMCLVVFIPIVSRLNPVEIAGFAGMVFLRPGEILLLNDRNRDRHRWRVQRLGCC